MKKEINIKDIKSLNVGGGPSNSTIRIEGIIDYVPMNEAMKIMKSKDVKILYESEGNVDILDDEERKYLKEVIRPFRDRVDYIEKSQLNLFDDSECYIEISIDDEEDCVSLPNFDANDMYLGMELNREYSLEELGL